MRLLLTAAASLALAALAGCTTTTDAALCRYWTNEPIGRGVLDPSTQPMLPYNPYWVERGSTQSAQAAKAEPCAGEPGHLAFVK